MRFINLVVPPTQLEVTGHYQSTSTRHRQPVHKSWESQKRRVQSLHQCWRVSDLLFIVAATYRAAARHSN